jgi:hypothetical protein
MKKLSTIVFAAALLFQLSDLGFAQGRGQVGRPAGAGAPQSAGMRGNRPASPASDNSGSGLETAGKPDSAGPKDPNGFKNYGQYVAAQHIAENLSIPGGIDALKTLMTGDNSVSLGEAIEQLRPDLSEQTIEAEVKKADAAAKKAEAEARKGGKPIE